MKKVTYFGLLLAVALTGLSSCSSSDDVTSDPTNTKSGESRLTLTISTPVAKTSSAKGNSFAMGSRATDIKSDPGTTAEQTINRITVGIFSSEGTVRTIQVLKKSTGTPAAGDRTYSQTAEKAEATIVTNSLTATDKIYVVCNAPEDAFNGVQSATDFQKVTENIDNALITPSTGSAGASIIATNIPMYGESTLSSVTDAEGKATGNFKADVTVHHQTAKVTLSSLTVDFDQNGAYKDAKFTPTRFFLINVPNDLKFNTDATTGTMTLLQGYAQTTEKTTDAYKEYLTTSPLTGGSALSGNASATSTNKFGSTYYFYTMPNSLTAEGKCTKLVIEGNFKSNSGDTKGTTVYYPVPLNATYDATGNATVPTKGGAKLYAVYPDKNYKCTVTIKTKGAGNPYTDITPQQAAITVTVSSFTDVEQTTIFN